MNDERPYRPSNGTEGEIFMGQWCHHCIHEADEGEGEFCEILSLGMSCQIGDPDYPDAWVTSDARGPRCKAFCDDPSHPPRCPLTGDLFDQLEG